MYTDYFFHDYWILDEIFSLYRLNTRYKDITSGWAIINVGNIKLLDFMETNGYDFNFNFYTLNIMAAQGKLNVVKWLYSRGHRGSHYAMDYAARNGHLEIIKFLHENANGECTIDAMDWAAENGYLDVVSWLHKNRSEGCSTRAMDYAAGNGHLHIIKWLHENRTEGCTLEAMNRAYRFGYPEITEWLTKNIKDWRPDRV